MGGRCIMCGRLVEVEEFNPDSYDDYEDEDLQPKKSSILICQLCQAKLRHEADEAQKIPKPM
ncbi:hypothetical protein D7024_09780 [Desulfofundulus salinus]|uniref:DUF2197 domain-containing protein n=2 Tax=Desulfofundulus salinus TaxID=2419843 RepID=A0A494WY19_9FIRM|nr:hypothetical protein D7024_09780 [Desulfofundulus salinum]